MSAGREHIPFEQLVEYWLDPLEPAMLDRIETHLLACGRCSERLQAIAGLGQELKAVVSRGEAPAAFPAGFAERLREAGVRVREYRVAPGGSVLCSIRPEDDLVLARLEVPLAGVARLDLVFEEVEARRSQRLADVPFDRAAEAVVLLPDSPYLRGIASATHRVELLAVDAAGERSLGRYTFNHRQPLD